MVIMVMTAKDNVYLRQVFYVDGGWVVSLSPEAQLAGSI